LTIANKDFKIKFNIESANIFNEKDSVMLRVVKRDKMYVVKVVQPYEARFANSVKANIWHEHYGYLN